MGSSGRRQEKSGLWVFTCSRCPTLVTWTICERCSNKRSNQDKIARNIQDSREENVEKQLNNIKFHDAESAESLVAMVIPTFSVVLREINPQINNCYEKIISCIENILTFGIRECFGGYKCELLFLYNDSC